MANRRPPPEHEKLQILGAGNNTCFIPPAAEPLANEHVQLIKNLDKTYWRCDAEDHLDFCRPSQIGAIANQSQQHQYSGRAEAIHLRSQMGVWKNAQADNRAIVLAYACP
jgi:hypothetical protein